MILRKQIVSILLLGVISYSASATDYYVSKTGKDTNPGSKTQPFLTISKAASLVNAGDVVNIMRGTYRETVTPARSGSAGKPIVFQSVPGENVIISAMEPVSGFTLDAGSIYKTTLSWNLGQRMFVVHDNTTVLDLARWPNNTDGNRFTIDAKRNTGGSDRSSTSEGYLLHNEIPQLPWENGGSLFFFGDSRWYGWKFPVTSVSQGRIDWKSTHPSNASWIVGAHAPGRLGEYFLEGIKEAIDYQNEWYFDPSTKELFLQLPGGEAPKDGTIEVSKRENTIYLQNRNYIEIRNLAVYGGSVIMNGDNNTLYGVSSFYGGMTRGSNARGLFTGIAAVKVGWKGSNSYYSNNVIEKCEIAFCDASAINVVGKNTIIKNNYIHDADYLGTYDSPIVARDGRTTFIQSNTITRAGRDCIKIINKGSDIAYNDVSYSNLIADDCGLLYIIGGDLNIDVHHNWFHDAYGRAGLYKAAGIYLDSSNSSNPNPEKVNVYNNVVWNIGWTNIQINWNGTDINVFNNTFLKADRGTMGAWHMAGTKFSNVNVWNNITDRTGVDQGGNQETEGVWEEQADKQNNMIDTTSFVDYANNDFTLKPTSLAVDSGRVINGYTDGYAGSAPDVGAYEHGNNWVAGISWDKLTGPTGYGCFGLPGEICVSYNIEKVVVNPKLKISLANKKFNLSADVFPDNAVNKEMNWHSTNPDVASVSESGLVETYKNGTTEIVVTTTVDEKTDTLFLEVSDNAPFVWAEGIIATPKNVNIQQGDSAEVQTEVYPLDADNNAVIWISRDVNIANVDNNGMVKGLAPGSTFIVAKNAQALHLMDSVEVDISPLPNTISCASLPSRLPTDSVIIFEVPYTLGESLDIAVEFYKGGANLSWIADGQVRHQPGVGHAQVAVRVRDKVTGEAIFPPVGKYIIYAATREIGQGSETNKQRCLKTIILTSRLINSLVDLNANMIQIYPNPIVGDELTVRFNNGENLEEIRCAIYAANGQLIVLESTPDTKEVKLNLNGIHKGLYILKVQTNTESFSEKIVVE